MFSKAKKYIFSKWDDISLLNKGLFVGILILMLLLHPIAGFVYKAFVLDKLIILNAQDQTTNITVINCVALLVAGIIILTARKNKNKKTSDNFEIDSLNSGIKIGLLLTFYFILKFGLSSYVFFFDFFEIPFISYPDVLFTCFIFNFLDYRRKTSEDKDETNANDNKAYTSFIEDSFNVFNQDKLDREAFGEEIAKRIFATKAERAFAIGISGKWGSGKSVVLNFVKKKLDKSYVVIEFDPWRCQSHNQIISDFFKHLIYEVKSISPATSNKLTNYLEALTDDHSNSVGMLFSYLKLLVSTPKPIQDQYEELRKDISSLNKKIVVFIDDIDRLNKEEIIEVLTLIRNTANFPNFFFVVAFDESYVSRTINHDNHQEGQNYLDKIFSFVVPLPSYKPELNVSILKELFKANRIGDAYKEELNKIFAAIDLLSNVPNNRSVTIDYINTLIGNVRDCVRLVNSFNFNFSENKKEEIEILDLLVFEIIKLKKLELYELIKNRVVLKSQQDEVGLKWIVDLTAFSHYQNDGVIDATLFWLTDPSRDGLTKNSFYLAGNFYNYFSHNLSDKIEIRDLRIIKSKPYSESKFLIEKYKKKNEAHLLIQTLIEEEVSTVSELFNICQFILVNTSNEDDVYLAIVVKIKKFLAAVNDTHSLSILLDLLNSSEISLVQKLYFARFCFQSEDEIGFSRNELKSYIKRNCEQVISGLKPHDFDAIIKTLFSYFEGADDIVDKENHLVWLDGEESPAITDFIYGNTEGIYKTLLTNIQVVSQQESHKFTRLYKMYLFYISTLLPTNNIRNRVVSTIWKNHIYLDKKMDLREGYFEILPRKDVFYLGSSYESAEPRKPLYTIYTYRDIYRRFSEILERRWIAHCEMEDLPSHEARDGGNYNFEYNFEIDFDLTLIKNVYLRFMADDYSTIRINGALIVENSNNLNREVSKYDVMKTIKAGTNSVRITVVNSGEGQFHNPNINSGLDNPYGIVFHFEFHTK